MAKMHKVRFRLRTGGNAQVGLLIEFLRHAGVIQAEESPDGSVHMITLRPPPGVARDREHVWAQMQKDRIESFGLQYKPEVLQVPR